MTQCCNVCCFLCAIAFVQISEGFEAVCWVAWGLQQLVPRSLLSALLRPDDLRAVVCGDADVDVELLKVNQAAATASSTACVSGSAGLCLFLSLPSEGEELLVQPRLSVLLPV